MHAEEWAIGSYWSCNLQFLMTNKVGHLFLTFIWISSCEMPILVFCSFFSWVVCFFLLNSLNTLDIGPWLDICNAKSPTLEVVVSLFQWHLFFFLNKIIYLYITIFLWTKKVITNFQVQSCRVLGNFMSIKYKHSQSTNIQCSDSKTSCTFNQWITSDVSYYSPLATFYRAFYPFPHCPTLKPLLCNWYGNYINLNLFS